MPRPAFQPTAEQRELVRTLTGVGTRAGDVCLLIKGPSGNPIDEKTLRKYFRAELDEGGVQATAKVARTLYGFATDPNGGSSSVTAAIFWMKTRAGWRETQSMELSGKDGAALIPSTPPARIEVEIIEHAANSSPEGLSPPTGEG